MEQAKPKDQIVLKRENCVLWALLKGQQPFLSFLYDIYPKWGSIYSLLLLSDYHPRSMHFPPNDDDEDLLAPAEGASIMPRSPEDNQEIGPSSESAFSGWTEPALRSDRMSWSLIGLSYALAYELGVFGNYSDGMHSVDGAFKRSSGDFSRSKRADKIERLLYIYVTQACGRFGFPSPYPDHVNKAHMSDMKEQFDSGMSFPIYLNSTKTQRRSQFNPPCTKSGGRNPTALGRGCCHQQSMQRHLVSIQRLDCSIHTERRIHGQAPATPASASSMAEKV